MQEGNKSIFKKRLEIGDQLREEIKNQGIAIEQIEKKSVSKTIIYNMLNGNNYTIGSLLLVVEVLKIKNKSFKITV